MKRQIFIGDVQGCATALERLLDQVAFDPAADRLRFAGDLVNRGGQSLQSLRLVHSLGPSAMTVLGNHDLHLLAYAERSTKGRKRNKEFEAILDAADGQELLDWLRAQPLFWMSKKKRLALVHAGVDPRWGPLQAAERSAEVQQALKKSPGRFFAHMYGDRPRRWKHRQPSRARLRSITNVMTRMRYCDKKGRLDLVHKGGLKAAPKGFRPWFDYLHSDWKDWTLVFGHWSMLGLFQNEQVVGLDSGCVWGGALTALIVQGEEDRNERRLVSVSCSC
ncbi:MAG: symmetrical bis(5'-nucleosyl)-tetraphosphatase [Pseudomonadota bacterium]